MFERKPTNWMQKPLSDLGKYINGFAFKPDDWKPQGLPIVRIAQITGSSSECDYYQGVLSDVFKIDSGDLIFSWSGTLKVVEWNGGPAWLNQHLFKVVPSSEVHPRFLYHTLVTSVEEMKKRAHGSTMKHIKRNELKNHLVCLPSSLDEQKTIANILDTLDTQIRQTEAIIAKLQQVKQGLLHDLLTRGIDENGQLRPTCEQAPELYKDSPLGWIPKEWEVLRLTTLSENGLSNGVFKEPKRVGKGVPLVNVADLYRGDRLALEGCELFDASPGEVKRYSARKGDIFFTRSSLKLEGIAQTSYLNSETKSAVYECHVMRLRPKTDLVFPRYLKEWCVGSFARKHFMEHAKQVTMTTISQDGIADLLCPKPDLDEQEKCVAMIESHESQILEELNLVEKLKKQKAGLMDDLLTGRVRFTALTEQQQQAS